jgi:flagellar basal-body rod modification protein FlgD
MTTAVSNTGSGNSANSLTTTSASEQSDRFLKLLVAQMKNQDPLNPLDNAQVTSQMAQISTVTGLDKVNSTITGLGTQFTQLQAMQGAALVGHDVAVQGDKLRMTDGVADGGFELASKADKVDVQILDPAGTVLGTVSMTAQDAGRHTFNWTVPEANKGQALTFKVTATAGANAVDAMTLEHQRISAVSTFNNTLALELDNGDRVAYDAVWAFL